MKNKQIFTKENLLYLYLLLLPLIDLTTSLMTRFTKLPLSIGMIVKGLFLAFLVFYVFFVSKSKHNKITKLYFIAIIIFGILYVLTKEGIFNLKFLFTEAIYMFKYFSFPVVFLGLLNLFDDNKYDSNTIKKIFTINIFTYTLLLLLAFLTNTSFNSYSASSVRGSVGWFFAANEIGAITVLLYPFIYLIMKKKIGLIIFTFPVIIAISLIGTKVSLMGIIVTAGIVSILTFFKSKKHFWATLLVLFIVIIMSLNTPGITNLKNKITHTDYEMKLQEKKKNDNILSKTDDKTETDFDKNWLEIFLSNSKVQKVVKIALNNRDLLFINIYNIYEDANFDDQLFGIGFTNREEINNVKIEKLIEIDILDILLRYGVIGFGLYFIPLYYAIVLFVREIKLKTITNKIESAFYIFVILLALGISTFAGHVLGAPSVSIYVALFMILLLMEAGTIKQEKIK